jgi:hypothetical protein
MKKTSVYLTDEELERLRRLAEREGTSQANILREALAAYELHTPDRDFAFIGVFDGDGTSIADIPDEELMKGFGEDSFGE